MHQFGRMIIKGLDKMKTALEQRLEGLIEKINSWGNANPIIMAILGFLSFFLLIALMGIGMSR